MGCYICNGAIDEPKLDPRDMKTAPCGTCEAIIQDCIDTYPKIGDRDEDAEDYVVYIEPEEEDFREFFHREKDYY